MLAAALLSVGAGVVAAHEEHERVPPAPHDQTLTGEVVDVFCYLSHGEEGLGKKHAGCAKKCIHGGLPVAIKVGDQLYLASMADHMPANDTLAKFAGQQVEVHGKIMERNGQRFIAVSEVEPLE